MGVIKNFAHANYWYGKEAEAYINHLVDIGMLTNQQRGVLINRLLRVDGLLMKTRLNYRNKATIENAYERTFGVDFNATLRKIQRGDQLSLGNNIPAPAQPAGIRYPYHVTHPNRTDDELIDMEKVEI